MSATHTHTLSFTRSLSHAHTLFLSLSHTHTHREIEEIAALSWSTSPLLSCHFVFSYGCWNTHKHTYTYTHTHIPLWLLKQTKHTNAGPGPYQGHIRARSGTRTNQLHFGSSVPRWPYVEAQGKLPQCVRVFDSNTVTEMNELKWIWSLQEFKTKMILIEKTCELKAGVGIMCRE